MIQGTRYKVDAYIENTNTVVEFLGGYWHGDLRVYKPDLINANSKITFKVLNTKTFKRLQKIKSLGYNVKYIWEKDYNEKGLEGLQSI